MSKGQVVYDWTGGSATELQVKFCFHHQNGEQQQVPFMSSKKLYTSVWLNGMKSAQELYGNLSHDDYILLQRGCRVHPGQSVETKRRRGSSKFLGCARRWEGGLCCIEHCDRSTSLWNGLLSNARRDPEPSSGEKDDSRWRAIIPYFCLLLFCPKSWKRPILFGVFSRSPSSHPLSSDTQRL